MRRYTKRYLTIEADFIIRLNYNEYEKDNSWHEEFEEKYVDIFTRKDSSVSREEDVHFVFEYVFDENNDIEITPPFVSFIGMTDTFSDSDEPYLLLVSEKGGKRYDNIYKGTVNDFMDRILNAVEDFYNNYGDEPEFE